MKNQIKIIASAVMIGLSSVQTGNAADYTLIPPEAFGSQEHITLARTVNTFGVPIIDGSKSGFKECKPSNGAVTFGFYSASLNGMVLCTANGSFELMKQTFVHEIMHMVQDCRAGLGNSSLRDKDGNLTKLQYSSLSNSHKHNIHNLYSGHAAIYEIEARELEDSPRIAWKYLVKYCK